jgi:hypothetical protein
MRLQCRLIKAIRRPHLRGIDLDLRHSVLGDPHLVQVVDHADNLEAPLALGAAHAEGELAHVAADRLIKPGEGAIDDRDQRRVGSVLPVEVAAARHVEVQHLLQLRPGGAQGCGDDIVGRFGQTACKVRWTPFFSGPLPIASCNRILNPLFSGAIVVIAADCTPGRPLSRSSRGL